MAEGASNVLHIAAIRIRAVGYGDLDLEFQGYDDILTENLTPLVMSATNSRESRLLSNFQSQMVKLKGSTDEINEIMRITSIVIFVKDLWSEYPG